MSAAKKNPIPEIGFQDLIDRARDTSIHLAFLMDLAGEKAQDSVATLIDATKLYIDQQYSVFSAMEDLAGKIEKGGAA
ncbi:MAG: hypothetical protein ACRYGK_00190 [Janthinobacterium lividum]